MNTIKWIIFLVLASVGLFIVLLNTNEVTKPIDSISGGDTIKVNVNRSYYPDGTLKADVEIVDGLRHGIAHNYYSNGKVHTQFTYQYGFKEGNGIWFFEDGTVYQITPYVKGKKEGVQQKFYDTGQLLAEIPFQSDSLMEGTKEYLKNGTLVTRYPPFELQQKSSNSKMVVYKVSGISSKKIKAVKAQLKLGDKWETIGGNTDDDGKYYIGFPQHQFKNASEITVNLIFKTDMNNLKLLSEKLR